MSRRMKIPQYAHEIFKLKYKMSRRMKIPIQLREYRLDKSILENQNKCVVFSSTRPETREKVAIKCIPIEFSQSDSKETELMQNLSNKYIIKYIDSFYYPDQKPRFFSIVMPRAISDLLDYLLSHGPFTESFTCRIMKQSLQAVRYLHENKVWHRDLKLDNILVMAETPKGIDIAIADFGLADSFDNETYKGRCTGTLQYAAPELVIYSNEKLQFKKIGEYSNKVDTWSMGVVLYALISGTIPFDPGIEEDIEDLFKGSPVFDTEIYEEEEGEEDPLLHFQHVSEECKDLIRLMLRADPKERLSIDDVLKHSWFTMFENENAYEAGYQETREIFDVLSDNDNDNDNDDDKVIG